MSSLFSKGILKWQKENPRPLPWDGGPRDAYHIWISEIIMQQTRIEQGAPYYLRFIKQFPSVKSLAAASLDEVLRSWQGLGYYSRARNIQKAAQQVVNEKGGVFPDTYEGLLQLPGIGPYSAAAIASFAYGLHYPVVDGNVKRVISRFAGITDPIDENAVLEKIKSVTGDLMKGVDPGEFNQAIMNFGALVCKPTGALCTLCPLAKKCFALQNNLVDSLPVRSKKKTNKIRHFHFLLITYKGKTLLQRRDEKDIWHSLYTPPIIETKSSRKPNTTTIETSIDKILGKVTVDVSSSSSPVTQLLSHQTIVGRFHSVTLLTSPKKVSGQFVWTTNKTINQYGKPKMIVDMFEKKIDP